jgi:hypothetical protein
LEQPIARNILAHTQPISRIEYRISSPKALTRIENLYAEIASLPIERYSMGDDSWFCSFGFSVGMAVGVAGGGTFDEHPKTTRNARRNKHRFIIKVNLITGRINGSTA